MIRYNRQNLQRRTRKLLRFLFLRMDDEGEIAGRAERPLPPHLHQIDAPLAISRLQPVEYGNDIHAARQPLGNEGN
ncbi:hypothetical protein D3C80_1851270 [compost metagenome]